MKFYYYYIRGINTMSFNRFENEDFDFLFDADDYLNLIDNTNTNTNTNINTDFTTNTSTYNPDNSIENSSVSITNGSADIIGHICPTDSVIKVATLELNKIVTDNTDNIIAIDPKNLNNFSFGDHLEKKILKRKPNVDLISDDENVCPALKKREKNRETARKWRENQKNLISDLSNENSDLTKKVSELNSEIEQKARAIPLVHGRVKRAKT
jgi:hypothetical protein